MKIAFVYPGQGSQYVSMGRDLFEAFPKAKELYLKANEILGYDISKVSFEGPEEELKQTYITQPAIVVHSMAATALVENKEPAFAAGHSLGEFSALIKAGGLSFEDGLRLVKLRGELMQKAGEENKGTMAAVIGLDGAKIEEACIEASAKGIVQVANYNSPGQIVISGSVDGVKEAMVRCKQKGAKLVKELVVHGAFHSPLMEGARKDFKTALDSTEFKKLQIPVYSNVTAKPANAETTPEQIRESLYTQLISPVRWDQSIANMISDGANEFIELGPGKVLQGLIKRINSTVTIKGVDKAEDVVSINQ